MFELEFLRAFSLVASFLQLDNPASLFYLGLVLFGFFSLSRWCLLLTRNLTAESKKNIRIEADLVQIMAILDQQDLRGDMQKSIISEQEKRHTLYRKDLSDINSRIDSLLNKIDKIREKDFA